MASKESMSRVLGTFSDEYLVSAEKKLVKENRRGLLLAVAGVALSVGGVFCAAYDKDDSAQVLAGGILSTIGLVGTVNGLVEVQSSGEIILAIEDEAVKRKSSKSRPEL